MIIITDVLEVENLKFEKLNHNHVEQAARLAQSQYNDERSILPILPKQSYESFCNRVFKMVDQNLGFVALENKSVIGFMSFYGPIDNLFSSYPGVYGPIHGNGSIKEGRDAIYARLYEKAADHLVSQGLFTHGIGIYAHDTALTQTLFWNGFGHRCIDAVRNLDSIACRIPEGFDIQELCVDEFLKVKALNDDLTLHLRKSPAFMPRNVSSDAEFIHNAKSGGARFFSMNYLGEVVAFIKASPKGENFATQDKGMMNVCGAYMKPEFRGNGVYTSLLSHLIDVLKGEGYVSLGVDYETINATASAFWGKYFTPYTYSLVRRIDERILDIT